MVDYIRSPVATPARQDTLTAELSLQFELRFFPRFHDLHDDLHDEPTTSLPAVNFGLLLSGVLQRGHGGRTAGQHS